MHCITAFNTSNSIKNRPVPAERHSSGLDSKSYCNKQTDEKRYIEMSAAVARIWHCLRRCGLNTIKNSIHIVYLSRQTQCCLMCAVWRQLDWVQLADKLFISTVQARQSSRFTCGHTNSLRRWHCVPVSVCSLPVLRGIDWAKIGITVFMLQL